MRNSPPTRSGEAKPHADVLCLSHLRWDGVFQRPQQLLTRAARTRRVFVFEEPVYASGAPARLVLAHREPEVTVATPHLPEGEDHATGAEHLRQLLNQFITREHIGPYVLWYYTPMALPYSDHLTPAAVVYDCMDQLAAFAGAPAELADLERELFSVCDAVFTGGPSLFEAKQPFHANVHCFPSSVDVPHFASARRPSLDPVDQAALPHPRLGYFGVIDERLDLPLIAEVAKTRPNWQIVLIGPTSKIQTRMLPQGPNIHYLGSKRYEDLPAYVAGWDVALMPFARNEATRFISPTKTPEYLAAGKPVVSTSIRDVVRMYGAPGYVRIADNSRDFAEAVEMSLQEDPVARVAKADAFLAQQSWDLTWNSMDAIVQPVTRHEEARVSCLTI